MKIRTALVGLVCSGALPIASMAAAHAVAVNVEVPAGVSVAKTSLGPTLVQNKGLTLYYFDLDQISPGASTCNADCAATWPPLIASLGAQPVGQWKTLKRDDGSSQWAYQGKPLYLFAADVRPGDVKGDGLQRFWHAVKIEPPLPDIPHPSGVSFVRSGSGYILADYHGRALYTKSSSEGACDSERAGAYSVYPAPVLAKSSRNWSITTDANGIRYWKYKGKALFTYEGDAKPADRAGESNPGWRAVAVE
jgi:predicted lipoprotein with Yx(FWY)xxD motif